ncbi:N-6 DNA methylase [uncultured Thiohalocapsa sp.]|uniref:restriction endonuclease subunit M n=1 Tax=uncultured Thiohalocapsa sp. TaxID=768990 RepID=UPI0025D6C2C0|nr:N-6 DNA methylase [uncultured Thiohalocapsa sp.]
MPQDNNTQTESTIPAGYMLDYVSGKQIKETKKELVRQRVVRALIHEYGFSPEDMALDFSVGGRKKVDVAIFHHGQPHRGDHLGRAVLCRPEPKVGRNAVRLRDFEQAASDLEEIEAIMRDVEAIQYGLWTNGLDFFYLEKAQTRFETRCNPIGDWPLAEESVGTREVVSDAHTRVADNEMLKITFRRCHNFIHGNEGMPRDAAFWQFLYLIFCKMHDEGLRTRQRQAWRRRFWAGPKEQFEPKGRREIRERVEGLFSEVKSQYKNIFRGNEEITLSDRALAFIVSELARYDFTRTDVDAKGVAYQELVGVNLRGDRGQYFTPRGVVKLVVDMLDPQEHETLLDPACGTGGFLVAALGHRLEKYRLGIVLPDGVLGNPAAEYIRWWIMRETQVLASVDLPVEAFIAEANVNILTSLLFLRRKDEEEKHREALGGAEEYQVFMAVADKVGFDRRGNTLYERTPDGEEIIEPRQHTERIRIGGRIVERTLTRSERVPDNDLPVIAEKYREFLREQNGLTPAHVEQLA